MDEHDPSAFELYVSELVQRAESSAKRHEWQRADELFREAMSLDVTESSRIAYAVCLAQHERFFEAISLFTAVLDGTDRSAIAIVCHNLASIYRQVGDFDLARRFQWRSTLMQDDSGSDDLLAMANDAFVGNHTEVAAELVMAAREFEDDNDADLIATSGLIEAVLDSPEDGLLTVFNAYRRHQSISDSRGMGVDLLNLAVLFGEVNRYRAERACLVRAIRCFEKARATYSCRLARQKLEQFDRLQNVRAFDSRRN